MANNYSLAIMVVILNVLLIVADADLQLTPTGKGYAQNSILSSFIKTPNNDLNYTINTDTNSTYSVLPRDFPTGTAGTGSTGVFVGFIDTIKFIKDFLTLLFDMVFKIIYFWALLPIPTSAIFLLTAMFTTTWIMAVYKLLSGRIEI